MSPDPRKPILLIDEAELHLHYDAQADLIQTFTSRDLTSQVIYSTHSAGCLPEDMGLGVKLVVPNNDSENVETSKIENKFWSSDTLGFSPLLYGMGANTLAFFPTRRAVVVEGQSDMLLLPTIFRQATKAEFNGFQIVPGLANVAKNRLPLLDLQGTSVSYLVDNDKDGRGYINDLAKCNVDVGRVFTVADDGSAIITVEDWVDDSCFNEAVVIYRDRYFSENEAPEPKYFNGPGKAAKLKAYEKTVSKTVQKVDLAYIILELAWDDPDRTIYNSDHAKYICALAKSINDSFAG